LIMHVRAAVLVKARLRVRHALAGDDDVALEVFVGAGAILAAVLEALALWRGSVGERHQAELQVGHLAEDTLGLGRVLDTRQLDNDAVAALALHQRLRYAEFIDAVAQRREVLAHGVIDDLVDGLLLSYARRPASHRPPRRRDPAPAPESAGRQ
jgi:hypothetical protein